ncbi:MAG: LysM peptidoglycan-binding domain-containing protein [Candidatus Anammoxibacter sp.]
MRRDTQIGVILGIVIIGIIAVFLSTRTNIKKPQNSELITGNEEKEIIFAPTVGIFENDTFIEETLESEIKELASLNETTEKPASNEIIVEEVVYDDIFEDETTEELEEGAATEVKEIVAVEIKKEIKILSHKVELNDNLFSLAKRYYGDPKKWIKIYNANIDVIYDRNSLPMGDELIIPDVEILNVQKPTEIAAAENLNTIVKQPVEKEANGKNHTVKPGDTLYVLSKSYYGDSKHWKLIFNANKYLLGNKNSLIIGQRLLIPTIGDLAVNKVQSKVYKLQSQTVSDNFYNDRPNTKLKTYTIKKGDTLYKIAKLHYNDGNKWRKIYDANSKVLTNSQNIPAGKTVIIPR